MPVEGRFFFFPLRAPIACSAASARCGPEVDDFAQARPERPRSLSCLSKFRIGAAFPLTEGGESGASLRFPIFKNHGQSQIFQERHPQNRPAHGAQPRRCQPVEDAPAQGRRGCFARGQSGVCLRPRQGGQERRRSPQQGEPRKVKDGGERSRRQGALIAPRSIRFSKLSPQFCG